MAKSVLIKGWTAGQVKKFISAAGRHCVQVLVIEEHTAKNAEGQWETVGKVAYMCTAVGRAADDLAAALDREGHLPLWIEGDLTVKGGLQPGEPVRWHDVMVSDWGYGRWGITVKRDPKQPRPVTESTQPAADDDQAAQNLKPIGPWAL